MFIFVAGEATVDLDGTSRNVARGDVVVCPRGTMHGIRTGGDLAAYYAIHAF